MWRKYRCLPAYLPRAYHYLPAKPTARTRLPPAPASPPPPPLLPARSFAHRATHRCLPLRRTAPATTLQLHTLHAATMRCACTHAHTRTAQRVNVTATLRITDVPAVRVAIPRTPYYTNDALPLCCGNTFCLPYCGMRPLEHWLRVSGFCHLALPPKRLDIYSCVDVDGLRYAPTNTIQDVTWYYGVDGPPY